MRTLELAGVNVPVIGQGTWRMGEDPSQHTKEVAALRLGIELGMTLIDTAEMYAEGGAEEVVAQAISGLRDQVFVVSKVYPHNASCQGIPQACERSLRRLKTDYIDLYLLHWRGQYPLRDTVAGMQALQAAGKIRHWGVSNLDVADMDELLKAAPDGGGAAGCATNQVYYSLSERGIEHSLLPWLRRHRMPLMAYSPIDQGQIAGDATLAAIGSARGLSAAQVALAWVLAQDGVIAIPKAVSPTHLRENLATADIVLSADERSRIEAAYPAPQRKTPLAML